MITTTRRTLSARMVLAGVAGLAAAARPLADLAQAASTPAAAASKPTSQLDPADVIAQIIGDDGILRFDVAEDASRFIWAAQPVHDDGMPAYGNPFVTQGYLYPEGTLSGTNGALEDGSPEFPERLLGEWTCRGWMVGDGARTATGPMVITTQIYNFGQDWGAATLVSEGYELADIDVPVMRAVTGGTGPFVGSRGAVEQRLLGFTEQMGVNLRFAIAPDAADAAALQAAAQPQQHRFTWIGTAAFGGDA